jgi:hypothetical protein
MFQEERGIRATGARRTHSLPAISALSAVVTVVPFAISLSIMVATLVVVSMVS